MRHKNASAWVPLIAAVLIAVSPRAGRCDVTVKGNAVTSVNPVDFANQEAERKTYLLSKGMSEAQVEAYLYNYSNEYFGSNPVPTGLTFTVRIDGAPDFTINGETGPGGAYAFTIPEQYRDEFTSGKVTIQFEMDGADWPDIYKSAMGGKDLFGNDSYIDSGTVKSPQMPLTKVAVSSTDMAYVSPLEITDEPTAFSANILASMQKIDAKIIAARDFMPDFDISHPDSVRYLSTSAGTAQNSLMDINTTLGTSTMTLDQLDPVNVLSGDGSGTVYHEYGHLILSKLFGSSYLLYLDRPELLGGGGEHAMGGRLNLEKVAFNESFAHFIAGVGMEVPKGIYDLYDKEWAKVTGNAPNQWKMIKNQEARGDPAVSIESRKTNFYNSYKTAIDKMEAKYNELNSNSADANNYEGYATEFFNELYFSGKFDQDEALGKIFSVLETGLLNPIPPGNIDEFFARWKDLYPEDAQKIDEVKQAVIDRIFTQRAAFIEQMKAEMRNLHDELWPPDEPGGGDPCSAGTALPGSGCEPPGDGPYFVPPPPPATALYTGLAACPGKRMFFVSDYGGRQMIMFRPDEAEHRSVPLMSGLDNPGDVDVGEAGASIAVSVGGAVRKNYLGLTVYAENEAGAPLGGADVIVQNDLGEFGTRTDANGYATVLDLLRPGVASRDVIVNVVRGRASGNKSISLGPCQTFARIVLREVPPPPPERKTDVVDPEKPVRVELVVTPPDPPPGDPDNPVPPPPQPGANQVPPVFLPGERRPAPPPDGGGGSTAPPTVRIVTPVDGMSTNEDEQVVRGTVSDRSVTKATVTLNGVDIEVPVYNGEFAVALTLATGPNTITAKATGLLQGGQQGAEGVSEPVQVTYDPAYSGGGAVYGRVTNAYNGQPYENARVVADGTGQETATGPDGYYGFPALPAGSVSVTAQP
ncbi:MAG: carboxypeptidase regulatory-like domain-containing protein [Deltaproteobacteria bacterium]|nr:carboxypeptidase regulatory-like domain-containing protein [Deltaproteobacteria bacterium]